MNTIFLWHTSKNKYSADAYHKTAPGLTSPGHWAAISCLLLTLAFGSMRAESQGIVFENSFEFSSTPITTDWQLLYGYESGGISRDMEGVIDLETDDSGNIYALVDRRYGSDSYSSFVLLLTVDSTGSITNALRLIFSSNVAPLRFKQTADGNFVILIEQNELIKITPAGTLVWAKTLTREPYAFGGLNIREMNTDSSGNIFVAGHFNPSEPGDSRGFVAKLDSSGAGLWMRSWDHDSFFERIGLAVSDNGNAYVTDRIPGTVEFNTERLVFGFNTSGTAIGQASLLRDTSNGPVAAVHELVPIAEGSGVTIVGFRNASLDGDVATLVYKTTFDNSLQLIGNIGTRLESEGNLYPISRATAASRSANGSIRLSVGNSTGYGVVTLGAGTASAFVLENTSGITPFVDEDDYPAYVASGPNNELYIGGTSEQPGTVRLTPVPSSSDSVPLNIENPGFTVNIETLILVDGATTLSFVESDPDGVINEPEDGDEDALLIKVSF